MFFWTLDGFELIPKLPGLTPDTPSRRGLMAGDWKVTIRRGGTEFILDVFL